MIGTVAPFLIPGRVATAWYVLQQPRFTVDSGSDTVQVIDTLCTECASLIENHEKIQVLSAVHYNLGKTLQDVQNIVALPNEASHAEAMLREDVQLLEVTLTCKETYCFAHCLRGQKQPGCYSCQICMPHLNNDSSSRTFVPSINKT